jgi:tetratricopeptide (TPR) repeat protein
MAKFIKCPTCTTPIEVTPQLMGQVVKCPNCGKGIKLVAKKSGASSTGASMGGASNPNASVAGHSETMRSFMGEPAIQDEPPRLDTTCAKCGNSVDEADLVEDEGQLVCKECAIASAAERAEGAIEDYAPAPYVPSKRGSILNFNGMFFLFCFFALLFGGAEVYLRFVPMPDGSKASHASIIPKRPTGPSLFTTTAPATQATSPEVVSATQPDNAQEKADAEWEQANKDQITMRFNKANQAFAEGKKDEAEAFYKEAFNFIEGKKFKDATINSTVATAAKLWDSLHARPEPASKPVVAVAPTPPVTPGTPETPPAETTTSPAIPSNPLVDGLQKLKDKDYNAAARSLEEARRRLIYGPVTTALTSDQALVLVAKAAADIGRGKPEDGRPPIDLAYKNNIRTRPAVLNRAIIYLASAPGHASIKDFTDAVESVRRLLDSESGYDEVGANVLGTLLDRLSNMQLNPATRTDVITRQKALDGYNDRFTTEHEGKMKWGTEWLPADDVKRYRLLKGSVQDAALSQLNRELEQVKTKVINAQKAVERGSTDASKQLEAANAALKTAQEKVDNAKQAVPTQHWLEQFEPVIPEESPKS